MVRLLSLVALITGCLLVGYPVDTSGAKIMLEMTSIINTVSQHIILSALTEPLVERGHQVILLAPMHKITKGLTEKAVTDKIYFKNARTEEEMVKIIGGLNAMMIMLSQDSVWDTFQEASEKLAMLTEGCVSLFKDTKTLQRLRDERFDLIISMPIVGCDALLAEYLGVPWVAMTPLRRMTPFFSEDTFGIPAPSSYVPFSVFTTFTDKMSFMERVVNNVVRNVVDPVIQYVVSSPIRRIKNELNIRPDLSLSQLIGKAQLWLCHSNFALEFAQPIAPNWISIGGLPAQPAKPLPKDLEDFVQGSGDHGVILFTLGSVVTTLMDDDLTEKIAKVFSELPQRVLWRYKGDKPRTLGNNTLISDWLPQNDILGHPKTRLIIYHGGANGVYEAVSHGVPLLVMPLAGDQMGNAARVEAKGLGIIFNKNTLTEDNFRIAITEVLNNPKYKTNMIRASGIMKDQLASPRETAAFWIEHVLKFGGDHLRMRAMELNFIQRNSIDVIAFFVVVLTIFVLALRLIIVKCCCRLCAGAKFKSKKD